MGTDLVIQQGKTFSQVLRWETQPIVYKAITAITQAAPVKITAVGHGVPPNWRVAVISAKGMTQINSKNTPPRSADYHQATVVDVDNISLNDTNSADYSAYTSGGYVQYNTPASLTGFTARMTIKDQIAVPSLLICSTAGTSGSTLPTAAGPDGTVVWEAAPVGSVRSVTWSANTAFALNSVIDTHELLRLDTTNGRIVLDTVNYTITLTIDAVTTAEVSWDTGVYDLEMVDGSGVVTGLISGNISVVDEVTT